MKKFALKIQRLIRTLDPYGFFRNGDLRLLATSLSFTSILSLVPFLAIVLATFQLFGGLDFLYPRVEGILLEYMKEAIGTNVGIFLKQSLSKIHAGTLGSTGIFFLLGTSYGLIRDIENAFNRIWQVKPKRRFHQRLLVYWLLFFMVPVLLAVLAGFKSYHSTQTQSLQFDVGILAGFFLFWGLWLMYKLIPDTYVNPKYAFWAALFSSFTITIIQQSLAWIAVTFIRSNKIYGSLATLPIVLFWILFVWYAVLFGSYICYFLQNREKLAQK